MSAGIVRSLRRIVDALQRSLFDELDVPRNDGAAAPPPAPAPAPDLAPPDAVRSPRPTRSLVIDGRLLAFVLKRTRRRTIGFSVTADGLAVSAPKWVALRDVDAAVREKSRWIFAKLAEQRARSEREGAARVVWQHGATVSYLGAPVRIALDASHGLAAGEARLADAASGEPAPRALHVGLPHDASELRVREAVQSWLQREALRIFGERAEHFAARLGVRVTRLSLSSAKTRWGSASANGAVRLHWRLVHHALPTIDYVVAHELAHLREMNHGPRFWAVVNSVVPGYEAARLALRQQSLVRLD